MDFYKTMETRIDAIVSPCLADLTKQAIERANGGIDICAFLYVKPSTETNDGQLQFFFGEENAPEGWQLVTGEGLRGNIPYSEYRRWIRSRISRSPIFAWGK